MNTPASVIAAVLAAGSSRRFGSDKRRYPVQGVPMLQRVLEQSLSKDLPTLVVLHPRDQAQLPELLGPWLSHPLLVPQIAPLAEQGMGYSLAAAAETAQQRDYGAMLVMLGDMPFVAPKTLDHLLLAATEQRICLPCSGGRRGHPVLFGRHWFGELQQLTGDRGAKAVLQRHPQAVFTIEVDDDGVWRDIDTAPELGA